MENRVDDEVLFDADELQDVPGDEDKNTVETVEIEKELIEIDPYSEPSEKDTITPKDSSVDNTVKTGKWATARLVLGIISIVLFPIIVFESCASSFIGAMAGVENTIQSGGLSIGLLFLVSGIIMTSTSKSVKNGAAITSGVFAWVAFLLGATSNSPLGDLIVWGSIAFIFGLVYLLSAVHSKVGVLVVISMAILTIVIASTGAGSFAISSSNGSTSSGSTSQSTSNTSQASSKPNNSSLSTSGYVLTDKVLVDNDSCTVKITGIKEDTIFGARVQLYCENKTTDKTLYFMMDDICANGVMVEASWMDKVGPEKKLNDELIIWNSDLKKMNAELIDELGFVLSVRTGSSFSSDYIVEEEFRVYPTGLSSNTYNPGPRIPVPGEKTVIDDDILSLVILTVDEKGLLGYTLNCYVENKTDKDITVSWDDLSVNNYMINGLLQKTIPAGKKAFIDAIVYQSDLEKNKISKVEELEFILKVKEKGSGYLQEGQKYPVTFRPEE